MSKVNLLGYTRSQMEDLFASIGQQPYRGRQLFKWLYRDRQYDFDSMSDLPKPVRSELGRRYAIEPLAPEHTAVAADGTVKILFRLADGHPVESVIIPEAAKQTVCVSSQAGCALACRFCATGTMGLLRDLTVGEIVGQLLYIRETYGADAFTNIVFMGMGEPLNNYRNVVESIRILSDPIGLALSAKRITVSTSGISPKIRRLADTGLKSRLAVSLHAAIDEKRRRIMPVAGTFGLEKLMEAIRYYTETTGQRVTFEYILFDGFNDTMDDVQALVKLIHGIPCKINILAYNPVPGLDFERPSDDKVDWFGRQLYPRTPAVTVRRSRGLDIDAACGQLAGRYLRREA